MSDDLPMTADRLVLELEDEAREIGRRFPSRGLDREELVAEALLALCEAARDYASLSVPATEPEKWIKQRIRRHLADYARHELFAYLADVPVRLRRLAIRAHVATQRLAARGIHRPSYEQIAGEANIAVDQVFRVSIFKQVIVRQSLVEWSQDRSWERAGEPTVSPIFGPQPGFSPQTHCWDIHRGRIPKGDQVCCMVCHKTGIDGHPALKRSPATDPAPEPASTVTLPPPSKPGKRETRREQRARLFPPAPQPIAG